MWYLALALIDFIILIVVYALWLRPWLKVQPFAQPFLNWIEPVELALFKKSETILLGRLLWVGGLFVTFYDSVAMFASSLDLTPITTRIGDFLHIPSDMRGLAASAFIIAIGRAITWLRSQTTEPLELVSVSNKDVAANPQLAEAVAMADATKTEAVATVAQAKAT